MEERRCPVCKSDIYLNPDIVIYIGPCFHKMCESCMLRIFSRGQAPCPECGTVLRKINYIKPTFEDIIVEKECKIRRTLLRVFGREEEEFDGDVVKYNNYLERFEELVFEILSFKTESLVKERIREIQEMGHNSILNPVPKVGPNKGKNILPARKRQIGSLDEKSEAKTQKTGIANDYFDPEELPRIIEKSMKEIYLPEGFLQPNIPGGLSYDAVVSFAILSIENPSI
ncbi:RNA polymerase II transcription initiation/nucleotide excision repair factor TFIIH subunit TFB3 [Encephalitozoon intestinalis ATCC 50506]|uniref:RNA polymerase II transcription initiation/nucleotide excision repair factor TFIIH subunit TFB3 n=1 Tax=Encephalitozoon intestinalis (strain ATCC 50506) TaxID=876142 RepID=E0SA86_ENCIT|nr:RNA polymerase II transcription initiation/nucleotide excision repair factor TFIIH subunit TFB3 [Encephalitozoon intestinalis ATCC 50506]ADM12511.1 RNA polymerase II transcription initiation/nucleotide excision repair factor TFIIH subunit TFB3 [Encephalitozoon intestinalis ATCC 50506]UTX46363.1 RNA polymerase II transcription factor [Encephalitozoon intestinalis]